MTYVTKLKDIKRQWHLIDLKDKIMGRMATKITYLLQGKNKPYYSSYLDCGDYVVAINAKEVKVSGRKDKQKTYYHHSNYPGGFKEITFAKQMEKDPRKLIGWAVKNMLPKNKLRDERLSRLKIFINSEHNYKDKFKTK